VADDLPSLWPDVSARRHLLSALAGLRDAVDVLALAASSSLLPHSRRGRLRWVRRRVDAAGVLLDFCRWELREARRELELPRYSGASWRGG
jgi:hypothetical protein